MEIGRVISEKRKEKKLTQKELAIFLGVSKAAVSKWETGLTYPDITLLPLLAAFFNLTMDELFDYHSQLSTEEIKQIYTMLKTSLEKESGAEVLMQLRQLVQRYYSCYPFVLQMGLFLMNHWTYFPEVAGEEKEVTYMKEAREWFLHVKTQTNDFELMTQARNFEANALLALKQPAEVLELLGEFVPAYFPTETLIAVAFQQQGENQRGIATLQSSIAQYLFVIMSGFTNYLQFLLADEEKFQMTYERGSVLAETFALEKLNPVSLINFQLSALFGFAQFENHQATLGVLTDFSRAIDQLQVPLTLHGDKYFDQIDPWLNQLELGNQLPRKTTDLKAELLAIVLESPLLARYQETEIFQKINELKEQEDE
ncbi:helix-turn-helix domain-containing protein [Enterococcus sp. LJL98]